MSHPPSPLTPHPLLMVVVSLPIDRLSIGLMTQVHQTNGGCQQHRPQYLAEVAQMVQLLHVQVGED